MSESTNCICFFLACVRSLHWFYILFLILKLSLFQPYASYLSGTGWIGNAFLKTKALKLSSTDMKICLLSFSPPYFSVDTKLMSRDESASAAHNIFTRCQVWAGRAFF